VPWTEEDEQQLAFLRMPPGQPGSGRIRYAAAMHFSNRHMLSQDALEVFRILAKEDATDPRPLLLSRNLAAEFDQLLNGRYAR
jgi:hypothetical protein